MREITSIIVLGKRYTIHRQPDYLMFDKIGWCDRNNSIIVLNKSVSQEQQAEKLIHEVIHAIDDELSLGLDEEQVARLAVGLYSAGLQFK